MSLLSFPFYLRTPGLAAVRVHETKARCGSKLEVVRLRGYM
jgi:hypothetical protein